MHRHTARTPFRSRRRRLLLPAMLALAAVTATAPQAAAAQPAGTHPQATAPQAAAAQPAVTHPQATAPQAAAAQPAGTHPQALTDQAGLARLRAARTGDHASLANLLKPFMERYATGTVGITGLGAYAVGAEVFQDQRYIDAAKRSLAQVSGAPADRDLQQAE